MQINNSGIKLADFGKHYRILAERFAKPPIVVRYDDNERKEAWTLAHTFLDLQESFNKFYTEQLPAISKDLTDEDLHDLLLDIGEKVSSHSLSHS